MKKFGFGCMRLPVKDGELDIPQITKMFDRFIEEGGTYFDTAHGYLGEKSEVAIRECLTSRYPREAYQLTNKLSYSYVPTKESVKPFVRSQLEICGVDYFDTYLIHAVTAEFYPLFEKNDAFKQLAELKEEGLIKRWGLSYHDKADLLDRILTEHPEIEVVQLQFNYLDYEDPGVESGKCYDVCVKHNKPVLVMEPVKGGSLVNLPDDAKKVLDDMGVESYAGFALRFCASFDNIETVLSGMSTIEQTEDNIKAMKDFVPFTEEEYKAVEKVAEVFKGLNMISCTGCSYCTAGCPMSIKIPELFSLYNSKKIFNNWNTSFYYGVNTRDNGKASDCIKCGQCEMACPQHLPITELLEDVAKEFEK